MNDLEQDLRELLETRARDAQVLTTPRPQVVRRARRRQARTVLVALAGVVAVVAGSVVGLRALDRNQAEPRPAHHVDIARTAVLPYAAVPYPDGWFLVDEAGTEGGTLSLQLTNFDAGLEPMQCEPGPMPSGSVALWLSQVEGGSASDPWPVELTTNDGLCPGEMTATWSEGDRTFEARAAFAPDASEVDRDTLLGVFAGLRVAPEGAPLAEALSGAPALVLHAMPSPVGPAILYVFEDGGSIWSGIVGPVGSELAELTGIDRADLKALTAELPETLVPDQNVGQSFYDWGAYVTGLVASDVERAEIRTIMGTVHPATLLELPGSLNLPGFQWVWGFVDRPVDPAIMETVLYDASGNALNESFPTERRTTVASGTDPTVGHWRVFLNHCNTGTGIGLETDMGGGGYGCGGLTPLEEVMQDTELGGNTSDVVMFLLLVSDDVARVVFYTGGGRSFEGELYPMPDESFGIPQVALLLVPRDPPDGQQIGELVAYDADGNALAEQFASFVGPPSGIVPNHPTPAIVDAVNLLHGADYALLRRASEPPGDLTFAGLDLAVAADADPTTTWNDAAAAVPGAVSLRDVADDHLVLATVASSGETFCVAITLDGRGASLSYGTQEAQTAVECTGGWGPGSGT